jgi:hypothetical protein
MNKEKNQKEEDDLPKKIHLVVIVALVLSCSRRQAFQQMVTPNKWYQS